MLRSHIAQFRTLLEQSEPIGRKLDFLVQELNREVNTIGSKAQDIRITQTVVEMKSEMDRRQFKKQLDELADKYSEKMNEDELY